MIARRTLSWFSCGAASAVATKLVPNAIPVYCETGSEHEDNERFLSDCELWFGRRVHRLRSDKFFDTWAVWETKRYLSGIKGAPCTTELKIGPRLAFQHPTDHHIFGYTSDNNDKERAKRLQDNYPELSLEFPLIDNGLSKKACLSLVMTAGIEIPVLYKLGFVNNNCLPCVKATSPNYWALVRKTFPDKFNRMAEISRRLNVRLSKLNGKRIFIDEIPLDHPTDDPIAPACDFLCQFIEDEIKAENSVNS